MLGNNGSTCSDRCQTVSDDYLIRFFWINIKHLEDFNDPDIHLSDCMKGCCRNHTGRAKLNWSSDVLVIYKLHVQTANLFSKYKAR